MTRWRLLVRWTEDEVGGEIVIDDEELRKSQEGSAFSRRSCDMSFLSAASEASETGETSVTSIASEDEAVIVELLVSSEMLFGDPVSGFTATLKCPTSCDEGEAGIEESS